MAQLEFTPSKGSCDTMARDGTTPAQKVEKILAFAPILPGQKASPSSQESASKTSAEVAAAAPSAADDLIDFGSSETAIPVPDTGTTPKPIHHVEALSAKPPAGLQQPLVPGPALKRIDTEEGSVDEFVDASAS